MKEIIHYTYEAFDGKSFTNAKECQEYEATLRSKSLGLKMLNDEFQELTLDEEGYESAYYLIINKQEDIEYIKHIATEYGYSYPWDRGSNCKEKIGIYKYNCKYDGWENYDDIFAEIRETYTKLLTFRKDMTPFERKSSTV